MSSSESAFPFQHLGPWYRLKPTLSPFSQPLPSWVGEIWSFLVNDFGWSPSVDEVKLVLTILNLFQKGRDEALNPFDS